MSEAAEVIQMIRKICGNDDLPDERKMIEIKRIVAPDSLDAEDFTTLGMACREMGLYKDALQEFWQAYGHSRGSRLDCLDLIVSTFEMMDVPNTSDLQHLSTTLSIAKNLASEWTEKDRQILAKLIKRFKALCQKHGFPK